MSSGLARALRAAGARPIIRRGTHPGARLAGLMRGGRAPILARGDRIWWPGAPADLSAPGLEAAMAVLQHELQHVLDYRAGWLTAARYLSHPRHWTYDWRGALGAAWDDLGAEQQGAMAEGLWLAEHGRLGADDLAALRRVIPWAQ